jgi:hypothetical protein
MYARGMDVLPQGFMTAASPLSLTAPNNHESALSIERPPKTFPKIEKLSKNAFPKYEKIGPFIKNHFQISRK